MWTYRLLQKSVFHFNRISCSATRCLPILHHPLKSKRTNTTQYNLREQHSCSLSIQFSELNVIKCSVNKKIGWIDEWRNWHRKLSVWHNAMLCRYQNRLYNEQIWPNPEHIKGIESIVNAHHGHRYHICGRPTKYRKIKSEKLSI